MECDDDISRLVFSDCVDIHLARLKKQNVDVEPDEETKRTGERDGGKISLTFISCPIW